MTGEKFLRFKRIYSTILSISILLAGVCLIAGCLSIYFSGDKAYSREIVAEVFKKISLPVYACLVLVAGSIILGAIAPEGEKKASKKIDKNLPEAIPDKKSTIIRAVFVLLGISLLLLGFFTGGTADVLTKAINICTECIGLG